MEETASDQELSSAVRIADGSLDDVLKRPKDSANLRTNIFKVKLWDWDDEDDEDALSRPPPPILQLPEAIFAMVCSSSWCHSHLTFI